MKPILRRVLAATGAMLAAACWAAVAVPDHHGVVVAAGVVAVLLTALGALLARFAPVATGALLVGLAYCLGSIGAPTSSGPRLVGTIGLSVLLLAALEVTDASLLELPRTPAARSVGVAVGLGAAGAVVVALASTGRFAGSAWMVLAAAALMALLLSLLSQLRARARGVDT